MEEFLDEKFKGVGSYVTIKNIPELNKDVFCNGIVVKCKYDSYIGSQIIYFKKDIVHTFELNGFVYDIVLYYNIIAAKSKEDVNKEIKKLTKFNIDNGFKGLNI